VSIDNEVFSAVETICTLLQERRVSLFLGAGINAGLVNESSVKCPLGQALSDMMARDLLEIDGTGRPLDSIAEMARYRWGAQRTNEYLHKLFSSFTPSTQHLLVAQLPWNVIYTTNYDTLIERASTHKTISPAGRIRRVVSTKDLTSDLPEEDIPYFKLHGCIEIANTEHGRLILTKEDYRFYEQNRKPLFRRLREDIIHHTLLFIGYSMEDDNFRSILEDCRSELNTATFPKSYVIRYGVTDAEKVFWRDKYNIASLNIDAQTFLSLLRGTWNAQNCNVVPFDLRHTNEYTKFDDNTSFQKVGESFYLVKSDDCTSAAAPKEFFKGKEPSWGDIREKVPTERDAYISLLDAMLEELVDPHLKGNIYLISGAAGTGKTTLVRTLAHELSKSGSIRVVIHISGTPLDERALGPLFDPNNLARIVVVVEHAAERIGEIERFVSDLNQKRRPATLVLVERKNLWETAIARGRRVGTYAEFELGRLSTNEIDSILASLDKHGALGKLTGMSREYQLQHFENLAEKELLVALRELTEAQSFDRIILDEYKAIPSHVARDAYRFVAALGQIDQPLRLEVLSRLLQIGPEEIGSQVMTATDGVLISGEDFGASRHNAGFRVQARHPIIASVVFEFAAPSDDDKYQIVNAIISHLNPTFPEDLRVLQTIVRNKSLVNTIGSPRLKRSIYDQLEKAIPNDPYVLQHRSLLEREIGDAEAAIQYARAALKMQPENPAFKNTLGFAYEAKSRSAEALERTGLLRQATQIFEEGIKVQSSDAYSYTGLYQVMRQRERFEASEEKKLAIRLDMLSMLEDALEATDGSHLIVGPLATVRETLGDRPEAIAFLMGEIDRKPQDARLRDLLVRMLISVGRSSEALSIAQEGTKHSPTAWRLQRHIARLQKRLGGALESVSGHYAAALRHNKGDAHLIAEYGAYLFMNGRYNEAEGLFKQGRQLPNADRKQVRERWMDDRNRDRVFHGNVYSITAAVGHLMAVPENFTVLFWRTSESLNSLRERDRVTFTVGFSACGAISHSIRRSQ
jgi:tetratricopeptide (TPR) repeat protein